MSGEAIERKLVMSTCLPRECDWRPDCHLVTYVTPSVAVEILEYVDAKGINPFRAWFDALDPPAAARVAVAITRLALGNWSSARSVGNGVHELRISFGSGYRVYFGSDGPTIVVLLAGGTKVRQQQDINCAIDRWRDYKRRKRQDEMKWH